MMQNPWTFLGALFLMVGLTAKAQTAGQFLYEGQLLDALGQPVTTPVLIKARITSPNSAECTLYEGTATISPTSNGYFNVQVGSPSMTRTDSGAYPFHKLFVNKNTFSGLTCLSGSSYVPTMADGRKMFVAISDDSGATWDDMGTVDIQAAPMATVASSLNGYDETGFVRLSSGTAAPITVSDFNELLALINGTSTRYAKSSNGTGNLVESDLPALTTPGKVSGNAITSGTIGGTTSFNTSGNITSSGTISSNTSGTRVLSLSNPSNVAVTMVAPTSLGSGYTLTLPNNVGTTGQVLATDGTGNLSWQTSGGGGGSGTVTSVATGTGLSGGPITSSGTISLANTAVTPGTYGTASSVSQVSIDAQGRVTNATNVPIAINWSNISAGKPTTLSGYGITDSILNGGGTPSITSGLDAAKPAAGTIGRLYVATDSNTIYRDNGSVWVTLGSSAGQWTTSGSNLTYTSGNIGIGTTAPGAPLDVKGALRLSGTTSGYVGFQPAPVAGSTVWTLPSADGTNGQVLTTNGAGILSWTTSSGGAGTVTNVATGTGLTGGPISSSGTISLANTAVTPGNYGAAASIPVFSVDAQGRLTSASSVAPAMDWTTNVIGKPTSVAGYGITDAITNAGGTPSISAGLDSSKPAPGVPGRLYVTSDTNMLLRDNGGGWSLIGGGGTPTGTASGDLAGTYPGPVVARLQGTNVSATAPTAGQVLKYNGSQWAGSGIFMSELKSSISGPLFPSPTCSSSQTLSWNSGNDQFVCGNIGGLNASAITTGTLSTTVLPPSANLWNTNGTDTFLLTGNLGIGTSTPVAKVHIESPNATVYAHSNQSTGGLGSFDAGNDASQHFTMSLFGSTTSGTKYGLPMNGLALLEANTANNLAIGSTSPSTPLVFGTNNVERMRITSSGNVGIGNSTPAALLDIGTPGMMLGTLRLAGNTSGYVQIQPTSSSSPWTMTLPSNPGAAGYVLTTNGTGVTSWTMPAGVPLSGLGPATTAATLSNGSNSQTWNWDSLTTQPALSLGSVSLSSGTLLNVTSSSTGMNGVLGNFSLTGNSAGITGTALKASVTASVSNAVPLMVTNMGTGKSFKVNDDGSDNDPTPFVVDANGNVGIGIPNPTDKLEVAGNIYTPNQIKAAQIISDYGTPSAPAYTNVGDTTTGIFFPTPDSVSISTMGTQRMVVKPSGQVGIGTMTPAYMLDVAGPVNIGSPGLFIAGTQVCQTAGCTSVSDIRLKENIAPLEDSLDKILQIQTAQYDYRDKERFGDKHQIGVIAQQLETIYPEVVVTDKKSGFKAVAYDHLVAPIIDAFKTLYARLVGLEEKQNQMDQELTAKADQSLVTSQGAAIEKLEAENFKIKAENEALKKRLELIEQKLGIQ